ncbi:hypothetical protein G7Y89_g14260 [Cudoniella acicularis]|uniref:Peptidase S8/S53 domain-containing protein n=1 Tax=Cudoniella acicularis TaxID=354080 RepID=A0A8H4R5Z0_9HELO|nr:hypothetical protein G7Y89_g14260 [Cudoniella acicularis]
MKLLTTVAFLTLRASALVARAKNPAPYHKLDDAILLKDQYIVQFQDGYTLEEHFETIGIDLSKNATSFYPIEVLNGYQAELDYHTIHELIRYDPGVRSVEHDSCHEIEDAINHDQEPNKMESEIRRRWIDQFIMFGFWYNSMTTAGVKLKTPIPDSSSRTIIGGAGLGVDIYILDSGVKINHPYFSGRATNFNGKDTTPYTTPPITADDLQGHGTHVAGLAGGDSFGGSPSANIINVKTHWLGDNKKNVASVAGVARAISDVVAAHNTKKAQRAQSPYFGFAGSIINMSFNLRDPQGTIAAAITAAFDAGIVATVSAGNQGINSQGSLCNHADTVCVAATDNQYQAYKWSNYGRSIKIWAPGVSVESLSISSTSPFTIKSGTSMAAPIVCGIMANFIGHEKIYDDAKLVVARLTANQLNGVVELINDSAWPTVNAFVDCGINNPTKSPAVPYMNAPQGVEWGGGLFGFHGKEVAGVKEADVSAAPTTTSAPSAAASVNVTASELWGPYSTSSNLVSLTGSVDPEPTAADGSIGDDGIAWDDVDNSTITSSPPSSAPTATPCFGNQVQASGCIAGELPSSSPDSGTKPPACEKADGAAGSKPRMNTTIAAKAASDYCNVLISGKIVLTASDTTIKPYMQTGVAENKGSMTLTVMFDVDACPSDGSMTTLDFAKLGLNECFQDMYTAFSLSCVQDSTWTNYNPDFTLEGGAFESDCGLWLITSDS